MRILIKEIRILDKKKNLVGSYFSTRPKVIKPSRSKSILLRLCDSEGLIRKHDLDLNGNMIIEVREYDGKVYRFKKGFPVG